MRIGLSFREPLVGEAIACLIENRRGWSACFVAGSVERAIHLLHESPVRVLLVDATDLRTAELGALLAMRDSGEAAVVLLAAEADPGPYLDLPVDRVLPRHVATEEMFAALDELARRGGRPRAGSLPFDLSRRELECAQLVARGLSNRRIAELTHLREQSVKNVVSLAMKKMGVDNRVQVALRLNGAGVPDALPTQAVVSLPVAAPAAA